MLDLILHPVYTPIVQLVWILCGATNLKHMTPVAPNSALLESCDYVQGFFPFLGLGCVHCSWIGSIRVAARSRASSRRAHQSEHAQNPPRQSQRRGLLLCNFQIPLSYAHLRFPIMYVEVQLYISHHRLLLCWNIPPGRKHTRLEVPWLPPNR